MKADEAEIARSAAVRASIGSAPESDGGDGDGDGVPAPAER